MYVSLWLMVPLVLVAVLWLFGTLPFRVAGGVALVALALATSLPAAVAGCVGALCLAHVRPEVADGAHAAALGFFVLAWVQTYRLLRRRQAIRAAARRATSSRA